MTWKQIESGRELRLWLTQVILPVAGITYAYLEVNPDKKRALKEKFADTKERIKNAFKK